MGASSGRVGAMERESTLSHGKLWLRSWLMQQIYTMEVEIATTTILHPVESLHPKELHFLRLYIYGSALTYDLLLVSY